MPDYSDIYSENCTKVYPTMVNVKAYAKGGGTPIYDLYFNDSGESLDFKGHTYMPVAFEVTPPRKDNLEEASGSFSIIGVTQEYIEMVQSVTGDVLVSVGVVRKDQMSTGEYVVPPTEYAVESISITSANAAVSLTLKSGGIFGYVASSRSFSVSEFPGLNG